MSTMEKYLEHLSHALSNCTEERLKAKKLGLKDQFDYFSEVHRVLTYACRDIQALKFQQLNRYKNHDTTTKRNMDDRVRDMPSAEEN